MDGKKLRFRRSRRRKSLIHPFPENGSGRNFRLQFQHPFCLVKFRQNGGGVRGSELFKSTYAHRFKQFNELLAAGKVLLNIIHSRNDRWLGKGIKHPF